MENRINKIEYGLILAKTVSLRSEDQLTRLEFSDHSKKILNSME